MLQKQLQQKGYLLVLILVFGAVFFTMTAAFMGYVVTQHNTQTFNYNKERALSIAEAGLNYYKWFLAHNPDDITNGTGLPGPYVGVYEDPEDGPIGEFTLNIESSEACGDVYAVDITSTGNTYEEAKAGRTVYGRYARPTIAEFAYIINANVWAGEDRTIIGPYHANGVIRMDGTNNSTVTSGQENWECDEDILPCEPYDEGDTLDGVYGDGPNSDLWTFPSTPINFTGLTVDLDVMQDKAENGGGIFIGPSGRSGYHVTFKSNGTFDLRRVRSKENEPNGHAWGYYMNIMKNTQFIGNYDIPSDCAVIYIEDQVWLDGVVNGKVTIAAANVDSTSRNPSIILNDNITYANEDSGLLAVAEYDILVGFEVPDDMVLNGIFIAQNGHFGRNFYDEDVPNAWEEYIKRNSLTINGTIVSKESVGTKWVCNPYGSLPPYYCSGFETRYNSYDRDLVAEPPPLTPKTSDSYEFIEWREMN